MRKKGPRRGAGAVWGLLVLFLIGCGAAYSRNMGSALRRLENREYEAALARIEKPDGKTNELLYRLERGLILHYQGQYAQSNQEFEKAERLIDELFTRSLSREVAALVTNDAIRAYRGEEFERVLINYYRALNYQYQGDLEGALVECRKANLKLEDYARVAEYELSYKNDPFVQYATGLFYEAQKEWNDAYISYRQAEKGYRAYQQKLGLSMPRMLVQDLARLARRLGYEGEFQTLVEEYGLGPEEVESGLGGQVILFAESGFIARKHQYEIDLPILEGDEAGEIWVVSDRLVDRYHQPYLYRHARVKYWLRLALPEYRPVPSRVSRVRLSSDAQQTMGVLVEDLEAIALKTLEEKRDDILRRTAARALAKYLAARGVEKAFEDQDDSGEERDRGERLIREGLGAFLGTLVNLFGVATEAADTRSWLALPARIYLARLTLPPGTADLRLEFLDERGRLIEGQFFPGVEVKPGRPVFLNFRSYR